MKCMGIVRKSIIFIGLLAVIIFIALIVFRQQRETPESARSVMEKGEAYAKVIETLNQFDKKTEGLAVTTARVDNYLISENDSDDNVLWEFILYDASKDLNTEEKQSVYFACVNASGKIRYIGQGLMMNSVLRSSIDHNDIVLSPESSYAFVLPSPTEMYFPDTGSIRYFNRAQRVEKDEIERIEVYDFDPLTKSKSQIKTVSIQKGYFSMDMPADGKSYEWTQAKGWIDKYTNQEANVDSFSWEILR